ncbi:MAG: DUF1566 domain-containing protein [Sulfurimonas sp.]
MKTKIVTALMASMVMATIVMSAGCKNDSPEVVYDSGTKLLWQDNNDTKSIKKDWQGATDYCKNLSIDKHNDWRLPSKEELLDLYTKKAILKNVSSDGYWSSTTDESLKDFAWYVVFGNGYFNVASKNADSYVRCVRAGQ